MSGTEFLVWDKGEWLLWISLESVRLGKWRYGILFPLAFASIMAAGSHPSSGADAETSRNRWCEVQKFCLIM